MYSLASATTDMLVWGGVLLFVVLGAGVAVMVLRRKFHPTEGHGGDRDASAFSIEGLEAMRASGGISQDEFRRLRRVALGLACPPARPGGPAERDADAPPAPPGQAEKPHPPLIAPQQDDDG